MRIRFFEDRVVEDHLGNTIEAFRAGEVVELSTASARHWINRNAAIQVKDSVKLGLHKVQEKPKSEPPPEQSAAFETYRQKELGQSQESGTDTPPSASDQGQASATKTSKPSAAPKKTDDAASSSSTTDTKKLDGPTISTPPTQAGGGRRRTPKGSKVKK